MKIIESMSEYEQLLKDNKSVFIDFYADWCGPCKMLAPVVEKLSEKYSDVAFAKVNVDNCPDIAGLHGIMSIPTLIAFKDGQPVAKTVGFQPEASLAQVVEEAR